MFEQIIAVLARQADAAITDAELFRLADTLFTAFARAGEDGLTAEQMRSACADRRTRLLSLTFRQCRLTNR